MMSLPQDSALEGVELSRLELLEASHAVSMGVTTLVDCEAMAFEYVDPAVEQLLGYTAEEIQAGGPAFILRLVHAEDLDSFPWVSPEKLKAFEAASGSQGSLAVVEHEYRLRHRDGSWRWFHTHRTAQEVDGDGTARKVLDFSRDITERKQAEEALQRSEEMLAEAQHLAGLGSFEMLSGIQEKVWSEGMYRLFEREPALGPMSSQELLGMVHAEDRERFKSVRERLFAEAVPLDLEYRILWKDGSVRHHAVKAHWVQGADRKSRRVVGAVLDITERKQALEEHDRLQERLRQSEKMEAVGQLAGGIAHDFNNQLSAIMGFAGMLEERLEDPVLHRYASNILKSCHRSADLIRQLLAFARKGKYRSVPVDMHEVIQEVVQILEHSFDKRITLRVHHGAGSSRVMGDPAQLQNALMNLALNARDAMPEGGELLFSTQVRHLDQAYCRTLPYDLVPGPFLQVAVTDAGVGMDKELQKRIFEPFFTTKEPGKGTGLGLASVYGTVKHHKGAINVYSEPGLGSCFKLYLPVLAEEAENIEETPSPEAAPGSRVVLVVEDEELVAEMIAGMLQQLGYQVIQLRDGHEAVAFFQEAWEALDLVILDLVMPRLSGRDAFKAMRGIQADARILLCSGYSLEGEAQSLLDEGALGFLQKPYQSSELARKVAEALRASRS